MAKCADCNLEMSDPKTDACLFDIIQIDGTNYKRSTYHFEEPDGRCHDCNIKHGQVHHGGCDVERCPVCGLQLISCEHIKEDTISNGSNLFGEKLSDRFSHI